MSSCKAKGDEDLEDSGIVDLYLSRDEEAISRTSQKYGSRLRALSLGIVADCFSAEECENDTYLEAWRSIPPHEPRSYLYLFLARITRHKSLNCCRERNALRRGAHICELTAEMEQCTPKPDDCACHMDDLELRRALNGFLETLSEEKRGLFLRRYWYLDSVSAISRRFSISESKTKTTLYRLRGQLRNYLEQEGYVL